MERIPIAQTPVRSVLLTPAPASASASVGEDSDDEGAVVDVEIENPFIDKTDRRLSSSSQTDGVPSPPEDKQVAMDDPGTMDELISTAYLDQFELAFNQKYKLLICQPCGAGIPLSSTHSHLKKTHCKRMMWQEHKGTWSQTSVLLPHQPSATMVPLKAQFIQKIIESLKGAGLIADQLDVMDALNPPTWYSSLPKLDLCPAVLGLRIFHSAYQCHICHKFYLLWNSIKSHYSTSRHGGSCTDAFRSKTVQTLTENYPSYFEVEDTIDISNPSNFAPSPQPGFESEEDDIVQAQILLDRKQQFVMPLVKTTPTTDLRQVLPVYHELWIHEFLSKFSDI
jgi:hypothetical protein